MRQVNAHEVTANPAVAEAYQYVLVPATDHSLISGRHVQTIYSVADRVCTASFAGALTCGTSLINVYTLCRHVSGFGGLPFPNVHAE